MHSINNRPGNREGPVHVLCIQWRLGDNTMDDGHHKSRSANSHLIITVSQRDHFNPYVAVTGRK